MAPPASANQDSRRVKREPREEEEEAGSVGPTMAPPAPTGDEKKVSNTDWLYCSVCDGTPKYSDVSHLLTHMSSKGHLHAFSQGEIRALNSPEAARIIETFKKWEAEHDIKALLASRLAAKESKDAVRKRKTPGVGRTRSNTVMKIETDEDDNFVYRAAGSSHNLPYYGGQQYAGGAARQFPGLDSAPSGPHLTPRYPGILDSRESSFLYTTESGDGNMMLMDAGPAATFVKLKGVTWPGMDIFDAADEDMKRKRNQRKDNSVTERLLASSESINTDEFVFNADFELQRRRDVYDSPSPPPEDPEDVSGSGSGRGKRRRSARTQLRHAARAAKTTRGHQGTVKDGRVTRARARATESETTNRLATPSDATGISDDESSGMTGVLSVEEVLSNSSFMSSSAQFDDSVLLDNKNEAQLDTVMGGAGMYHGGLPVPVHHEQFTFGSNNHNSSNDEVSVMGRNGGAGNESKRLDPNLYTPLHSSFRHMDSSPLPTQDPTINPALLTPPSIHAETDVDRSSDSARMALMDMSANHSAQVSPTPAPRMSLNRSMSYQGMPYYPPTGHFHGGNANPLCQRPPQGSAGYGGYPFSQTNPMYMHGHGQHQQAAHGYAGMMQQYGAANDGHFPDSGADHGDANYRVN